MKRNYIYLLMAILFSGLATSQELQKNFINYQGVARNAENQLMANEPMTVGVALKFGSPSSTTVYEENHSLTTDANGVFSLKIGSGDVLLGNYGTLPWGDSASFISVSINGSVIGTTEIMAVPYAISSGDGRQSADEVPYDNTLSGLSANTTQEAIDELADGGTIDTDNQDLILTEDVLTIEDGGGSVDLSTYIEDDDADPTNELQTISFDATTNELSLSNGGSVTIPSGGTDADADPTNEIDVTRRRGLLVGDDGIIDGLVGTADGQVAKWDAALGNWVAGIDETSSSGGSSLWSQNGDAIYYALGNVGVGLSDPTAMHQIHGSSFQAHSLYTTNDTGTSPTDGMYVGMINDFGFGFTGTITNQEDGPLRLGTNGVSHLHITNDGNVGLGVVNPSTKLEVDGDIKATGLSGTGERNVVADADGNLIIGSSSTGTSIWEQNGTTAFYDGGDIGIGTDETGIEPGAAQYLTVSPGSFPDDGAFGSLEIQGRQQTVGQPIGRIDFLSEGLAGSSGAIARIESRVTNGAQFRGDIGFFTKNGTDMASAVLEERMTIKNDGDVGIGVTAPAASLHVDGNIRSNDLAGTGTRNVVADADGNLTIGSSGGGSSLWNENGSGIHYTSGYVGIGTSTPGTALDVLSDFNFSFNLTTTVEQNYMAFSNNAGYQGYAGIWTAANDMDFGTGVGNTTGKVHLTTGATPKLTVDADGDVGIGTTTPAANLHVNGNIRSNDLAGTGTRNVVADSDGNLTIGSGSSASSVPIVFKVEGNGFAVKDLNGGTIIEADIWENVVYDTNTAFNVATKRFVVPETGYYFLHATVNQSNAVSDAFFGIKFNVIGSWLDGTNVDGDDVKTEISGIFRLNAGQEVFVQLRNYSAGLDTRVDGNGSIFEGYKIN
ncbi:hypothetical protein FK220_013905 [Flavobacteriaceae bacterium TP-CH-4]|uniref:C1q domain-containing protein n=1 Tax=Pelagihabitans pacificus TaxID=2696054 RepID=A0A967AUX0_9FLAO|nr:hypothetical protein [Pelagihabitans pacificus]NHF60444.1 hypothetical protein [Pelagihabitans pacificus]